MVHVRVLCYAMSCVLVAMYTPAPQSNLLHPLSVSTDNEGNRLL